MKHRIVELRVHADFYERAKRLHPTVNVVIGRDGVPFTNRYHWEIVTNCGLSPDDKAADQALRAHTGAVLDGLANARDGVALVAASHPIGEPVAEDADISEDALEDVEDDFWFHSPP